MLGNVAGTCKAFHTIVTDWFKSIQSRCELIASGFDCDVTKLPKAPKYAPGLMLINAAAPSNYQFNCKALNDWIANIKDSIKLTQRILEKEKYELIGKVHVTGSPDQLVDAVLNTSPDSFRKCNVIIFVY